MCKRGEIWWADIPKQENSRVQSGVRPVLIIANNKATKHSPVFQCVPLTTVIKKTELPTHVILTSGNLEKKTMALVEQTGLINSSDLKEKIGNISIRDMIEIEDAIAVQFGMENFIYRIMNKFRTLNTAS